MALPWGNYTAIGPRGSRHGLIGHLATDVRGWLADHPGFNGSIHFDYGNDEPDVDVTSEFIEECDHAGRIGSVQINVGAE